MLDAMDNLTENDDLIERASNRLCEVLEDKRDVEIVKLVMSNLLKQHELPLHLSDEILALARNPEVVVKQPVRHYSTLRCTFRCPDGWLNEKIVQMKIEYGIIYVKSGSTGGRPFAEMMVLDRRENEFDTRLNSRFVDRLITLLNRKQWHGDNLYEMRPPGSHGWCAIDPTPLKRVGEYIDQVAMLAQKAWKPYVRFTGM